jgi:cathepsin A (carboxypeptidase C)
MEQKGNLKWANNIPWKGQPEFNSKDFLNWSSNGEPAGTYKEVYIQMAGNDDKSRFAFLTISGAGHLVCCITIGFMKVQV